MRKINEGSRPSRKYSITVESAAVLSYVLSPIEGLIRAKLGSEYAGPGSTIDVGSALGKLKRVMVEDIDTLRRDNGLSGPPFDPMRVQKVGKAAVRIECAPRSNIGGEGSLQPVDRGFVIRIDETLFRKPMHQYRARSTVAHELMHTFFYNTNKKPPTKFGSTVRSRKHFLMEEELCYYLAREFLVPLSSIVDLMGKDQSLRSPSLRNIHSLKSTYAVSSDILAYRMVADLSLWDTIFIKFVKEDSLYRSITKLKSRKNPFYKKIKIPPYLPEKNSSDEWGSLLSEHVANTIRSGEFLELMKVLNHRLALESEVGTKNPPSVITIAYEED